MEIRQKDPTRNIEHKEIDLRSNESQGLRNSFVDANKSSESLSSAGDAGKAAELTKLSGSKTITFTPEEENDLLSQLSQEERKQWNSYSEHEKQQLLENVEKNVERKMSLRPQTVTFDEPPPNREKAIRNYRMESDTSNRKTASSESSRMRYKNQNETGNDNESSKPFAENSDEYGDAIRASFAEESGIRHRNNDIRSLNNETFNNNNALQHDSTEIRHASLSDNHKTSNDGRTQSGKDGDIRQRSNDIRTSYSEAAGKNVSSYRRKLSGKDKNKEVKGMKGNDARGENLRNNIHSGNGNGGNTIRTRGKDIRKTGKDKDYIIINGTAVRALKKKRDSLQNNKKTKNGNASMNNKVKNKLSTDSRKQIRTNDVNKKRNSSPKMKNANVNIKYKNKKRSNDFYSDKKKRTAAEEQAKSKKKNKEKTMQPGIAMRQKYNRVRGNPQENLRHRREQKRAEEVNRTRNKEFLNELKHSLSQSAKKSQNINNQIRNEQISQSQMENETLNEVARTASTPFRVVGGRIVHGITSFIGSAISAFIKYAGGFGGVFVIVLVVIIFFVALMPSVVQQNSGGLASGDGEAIVEYAKSWIGITKYVWGAGRNDETDWQDYADCSSFVHGVYSHFGIQLGWDTYAMEDDGEVISGGLDNAVPGDIILFYSGSISPNCSSHVGIYAGDGQMVHCSGGPSNYDVAHAGTGVCMKAVADDGRPYEIRRVVTDVSYGSTGVGGYNIDPTNYSQSELELIWAIVYQEDMGSYEGALAVISTAMNRVDSPAYAAENGTTALAQLTAPNQFCYSIDNNWREWLGGNVSDACKQAVDDCLNKGIRNHEHTQFRSGYVNGSEQIGTNGNYYFD